MAVLGVVENVRIIVVVLAKILVVQTAQKVVPQIVLRDVQRVVHNLVL